MRILRPIASCWLLIAMAAAQEPAPQQQAAQAFAQPASRWSEPAAGLATQITALAGPGPATLVLRNASSVPADQLARIRRLLENGLRSDGIAVRTAAEGAAIPTAIRVTLSQNAQHGLWVAEVQQGTEMRVAMVEVALDATPAAPAASGMTLRKQLLFTSAEPILDAQVLTAASGPQLILLTAAHITVYRQAGSEWQEAQSSPLNPVSAFPRDPRGVLAVSDTGTTRAYLPGLVCDASSPDATFQCNASDDPWPIGAQHKAFYNTSRNYFSGVLVPAFAGTLPPFYSAAEIVRTSGPATIFSDIHGSIRLLDHGALTELTGSRDWGSDVAALRSGCGSGTQLLADAAGDPPQDSLRAYEINGHEAAAVSSSLTLDGTVTAMHTAADKASATVILRSTIQQPAAYEVWRVSLDCH
jgi:hypothetical protein